MCTRSATSKSLKYSMCSRWLCKSRMKTRGGWERWTAELRVKWLFTQTTIQTAIATKPWSSMRFVHSLILRSEIYTLLFFHMENYVLLPHSPLIVQLSLCKTILHLLSWSAASNLTIKQSDLIVIGKNDRAAFGRKDSETRKRAQIEGCWADPERPGRAEETEAAGTVWARSPRL